MCLLINNGADCRVPNVQTKCTVHRIASPAVHAICTNVPLFFFSLLLSVSLGPPRAVYLRVCSVCFRIAHEIQIAILIMITNDHPHHEMMMIANCIIQYE